jgi:hypothetical protein
MRPSRSRLTEQNRLLAARNERLTDDVEAHAGEARATAAALLRTSYELSRAKDVVASHIVAAGHPSTVLQSPQEFAEALRVALADAGVDLRIELARLEGADL